MLFNQKMLRDGRIVFFHPLHLFFINPFYALQNSKIFDTQKNMKHFKIYSKKTTKLTPDNPKFTYIR